MTIDPAAVTILLAEDAAAMRKIEIKILGSLGFSRVVEAVDGADAVRQLRSGTKVDLVISDWNMPNMSGLDLLKWIRGQEGLRDLPFIMATGQSDKAQEQRAVEAGVNCFVAKPFSPEELRRKIEVALGGGGAEPEAKGVVGPQVDAGGKVTLRMAHIQITDHLLLGMVRERIAQGEVTPRHFQLETQCMASWNPVAKALEDGTVEGAFVLAPIAMDLFHFDVPIKLVLFAHKNGSIFVRSAKGNYSDPYQEFFRGRSVLIPHKMSIHHMLTHMFFSRVGLKASLEKGRDVQVNLEVVPPVKMPEFLADNPDNRGFMVAEPIGSKAVAAGLAQRLFLSSELWPGHPCCIVAMRSEVVERHPEAVQELVNELVAAGKLVAADKPRAARVAVSFLDPKGALGLKEEVLLKVLSEPGGITTDDLYPNREDLERIQRYMHREMGVGEEIDLGRFVDSRFADAAIPPAERGESRGWIEDADLPLEILGRSGTGITEASRSRLTKEGKYLTFSLGDQEFGVDILRVKEIIGLMDIIALPQSHPYVKGVIHLRDRVIPVMDLRRRFAMAEGEPTPRSCIVIVEGGAKGRGQDLVGMTVDGVSEVLAIKAADIDDAPAFTSSVDTNYILAMAKSGDKVKILLNLDRVLDF